MSKKAPAIPTSRERRFAWLRENWPAWAVGGGVGLSLVGSWLLLRYLRDKADKDLQSDIDKIAQSTLSHPKDLSEKLGEAAILRVAPEVAQDLETLQPDRKRRRLLRLIRRMCRGLSGQRPRENLEEQIIVTSVAIGERVARPRMTREGRGEESPSTRGALPAGQEGGAGDRPM